MDFRGSARDGSDCRTTSRDARSPIVAGSAAPARDAPTTTRRADGDGEIVASYVSVDRRSDEPRSACGVGYVCGGTVLACGVDGAVDVFDVTRPGRTPAMRAETRSRDG